MNQEVDVQKNRRRTAERLRELKHDIIKLWEKRSRQEIPAARDKDSYTVQDELTLFLEALIKDLSPDFPAQAKVEEHIGLMHGQQRSGLTGYTLFQVLREYSILREVLIDVLSGHGPLTDEERRIIHCAVDSGIQHAGVEFAKAEKAVVSVALARAEQSNRDLDQFAAIIAHDLRSPLSTIIGFTEVLQDEFQKASPVAQDAMTRIQSAVRRLIGFVDGVLNYARLGSETSEFEVIESDDAVQAATQNLKAAITEASGRVQHEKLPSVTANLPLLTLLFQNLIANSLKYRSGEPPVVRVKAADVGDFWEFSVMDNGIGFSPEHKETIFQFQKRLDTRQSREGAGIGLATSRRIIELHNGKIWAESEPGKGTTIFFTLPK